MVLVCENCGNVEVKVKHIGADSRTVEFFCPFCGNVSHAKGFTAGPIMLAAEKVREIKDRADKPIW